MTRLEETRGLRARTDVHFNCCQSVLVPFADVCGLDRDTAFQLGANFGAGMRHGGTCGAENRAGGVRFWLELPALQSDG